MRRELAMEHLAIDLGGKESQVCVRAAAGEILVERRVQTATLKKFLRGRPPSRVIVETCTEAFGVADAALACGHEVRVVPAQLVRSLGVGARGVKSDRSDARTLSEVSCRIDLPSVHIPSQESRDRKSMCLMREGLVECRTKLINSVRGWLRAEARRLRSGDTKTLPSRVRDAVKVRPPFVDRLLESIDELTDQIEHADKELQELADADPTCKRLMTVPGVGPVTSTRFAATVDEVGRFATAHQLESYLGLVPGEHSSGDHTRATSITKAGSPKMRWALTQACWVARRCARADPMVSWSRDLEIRRGKKVAVIALARKMAGIMFAIWRDGTTYDPRRGAAPATTKVAEVTNAASTLLVARRTRT
jgi:transposase